MTAREQEEYSALRTTIRERGTARVWIFVVGIIAWAAITTATAALAPSPLAVMLPLLVLAATFEAVFALHVGVERIGRYLQVAHADGWEQTAMAFGRPKAAIGVDPLFSIVFLIATLFNFGPVLVTNPIGVELIFVGGGHVLFVLRVIVARASAARQRTVDLARFEELKPGR